MIHLLIYKVFRGNQKSEYVNVHMDLRALKNITARSNDLTVMTQIKLTQKLS